MKIIKASGDKENFSSRKIYYSILEAGAPKQLAREITNKVKTSIKNNSSTEQIYKIILKELKSKPGAAERYNLKRAIMDLGPAGYAFEQYFSRILDAYGYKTKTGIHIKGKRIIHEVDILAEKKKRFMIECKYHNETGIHTKLQPALAAYARFLDLERHNLNQPWLVTNTRCTSDAINYAKGVNLKITSWHYPKEESLVKLIEKKKLYPITVLFLDENTKHAFLDNNVVMLKTLIEKSEQDLFKLTNIPIKELIKIKEKAKTILG